MGAPTPGHHVLTALPQEQWHQKAFFSEICLFILQVKASHDGLPLMNHWPELRPPQDQSLAKRDGFSTDLEWSWLTPWVVGGGACFLLCEPGVSAPEQEDGEDCLLGWPRATSTMPPTHAPFPACHLPTCLICNLCLWSLFSSRGQNPQYTGSSFLRRNPLQHVFFASSVFPNTAWSLEE